MPINPVDVVGNFQRGYQFGAAQKEQKRIEAERNQLRQLAPSVLQGDASAFNQAAAINPGAATELQDASDRQYRRLGNVIGIMRQALDSKNPQAIQRAHQTISPFLQEMSGGRPVPPQWDDSMLPAFEQIEQRVKMAQAGNSLATPELKTFNAMTAGLSPDDVMKARRVNLGLDPRAVTGAPKVGTITGADGRERPYQYDPATQTYMVFDGGQWQPLGGIPNAPLRDVQGPQGAYRVGADLTPEQLAAAQADMASGGTVSQVSLPDRTVGSLAVGRSPEEQAALTEQAKANVQLGNLPAELGLRSDAAVNQATREAQARAEIENRAKLDAVAQARTVNADRTLGLLAEAERLIPISTGSMAGSVADQAAAAGGYATQGGQAIAQLRTIAGQLTASMPRMEGPQSDKDVQMYRDMAGDLANPNVPRETRMAALKTIRNLQQKYASRPAGGKTVTRTGTANGRRVVQYSDGTIEYAD